MCPQSNRCYVNDNDPLKSSLLVTQHMEEWYYLTLQLLNELRLPLLPILISLQLALVIGMFLIQLQTQHRVGLHKGLILPRVSAHLEWFFHRCYLYFSSTTLSNLRKFSSFKLFRFSVIFNHDKRICRDYSLERNKFLHENSKNFWRFIANEKQYLNPYHKHCISLLSSFLNDVTWTWHSF